MSCHEYPDPKPFAHGGRSAVRTLVCASLVIGLSGPVGGQAQAQRSAAAGAPDFSGVYVGVRNFARPAAYPFTAAGERAVAAHDPYAGDPRAFDCLEEDMPQLLLWGVAVMQISHEDGATVMRVERGGTVRTIHMDVAGPPADQAPTATGYAVGHWAGDVLSVQTTHLSGGVLFAVEGYPVSSQARFTERYWRNPGERSLQMELVVHDPLNYTQPVTFQRTWTWSPQEQLQDYDCFSLDLDASGPVDIDVLRRRLEPQ